MRWPSSSPPPASDRTARPGCADAPSSFGRRHRHRHCYCRTANDEADATAELPASLSRAANQDTLIRESGRRQLQILSLLPTLPGGPGRRGDPGVGGSPALRCATRIERNFHATELQNLQTCKPAANLQTCKPTLQPCQPCNLILCIQNCTRGVGVLISSYAAISPFRPFRRPRISHATFVLALLVAS